MSDRKTGPVFLTRALWGAAAVLAVLATELVVPAEWLPTPTDHGVYYGVSGQAGIALLIPMLASFWLVHVKRSTLAIRLSGFASLTFLAAQSALAAPAGWMGLIALLSVGMTGVFELVWFFVDTVIGPNERMDWTTEYHHQFLSAMKWFAIAALGCILAAACLGSLLLLKSHYPAAGWGAAGVLLAIGAGLAAAMDRMLNVAWNYRPSVPDITVRRYGW